MASLDWCGTCPVGRFKLDPLDALSRASLVLPSPSPCCRCVALCHNTKKTMTNIKGKMNILFTPPAH